MAQGRDTSAVKGKGTSRDSSSARADAAGGKSADKAGDKAGQGGGDDASAALAAALRAVADAPTDDAAWDRLEQAAVAEGQPAAALAAYRRALGTELTPIAGVALGRRAAAFQGEWLADQPAELEEILERVLRIDPRCDWAMRQLVVALTLAQRWDALLAVYDRALASGPDRERRVALLSEAAQVAKDFVGRQELAITYLQELFGLTPGDPQVATVLERLLERHERWTDLIGFWRTRLGVVPSDEARALRERIALAQLERLGDTAAALQSLRALLGEKGDPRRVLAALEEILARAATPEEVRLGALAALEGAYDGAGERERALGAVEKGLAFATGAARKGLLRNATARRVAAHDGRAAIAHLAALLPLDPDDGEVEDWFRRLCRAERQPAALIDGLAAAAAATSDGARRAALRTEIAAVTDRELDDPAAAIAAHQRAWRETGGDVTTQRRTLLRLDQLLDAADRAPERLPVLAALAELSARPGERRAALGARARLATKLGDIDVAVEAWRACLGLDAADAEALAELPRVLAGAGRWKEHVDVLRHRMAVAPDPRAESADLARVALAERDRLTDRAAAIDSFVDHQRRFGPSVEATDALADLLTAEGRWPELRLLLAETGRRDRARAAALGARLGDACRRQLGDAAHAVDWYAEALAADPLHAGAREGLEALVSDASVRRRAVAALVAASHETGDWALRLGLRAARLEDAADGRARAAILAEASALAEERVGDIGAALGHAGRAVVADPEDRRLEASLMRLATATGDFAAAARAVEEAAGAAGLAPRRAAELNALAGTIHEDRLGATPAALAAYGRALAAEPGRPDLRLAVVRCAGRAARWQPLAEALLSPHATTELREGTLLPVAEAAAREHDGFVRLAAALGEVAAASPELTPDALLALEARIAAWHEHERGDLGAAEAALVRALGHRPEHLPTLHRLAAMQRRAPAPSLYETLRRIAALAPEDLDALAEATEWARDLALPDEAALDVARALFDRTARLLATGTAPSGTRTTADAVALSVEELTRRQVAAGTPEALRAAYDIYLRAAALPLPANAGVGVTMARTFRARAVELALTGLHDRPAAVRALVEMVDADPADEAGIDRLAALYEAERRYAELAQLRRAQLARTETRDRRLDLRLELERVGGAIEGASDRVALLMANLGEAPGHVPTIDALSAVLGASHRHGQLADTLTEQAEIVENVGDTAAAAALWSRVGKVVEEALGDKARAIAAHERAAALVVAAPTLDALGRLCMESGQAEAATRWLDQLLEIAAVADRPAVALRLAHAYLAIDRRHRAIACLERALTEAPAAQMVRALLIDLHRRAGASAPLATLLTEATAHTDDAATLLALAAEVNALAIGPLGDPALAVTALERAHHAAPGEQSVVLPLAVALLAAARPDDAGAVLEHALAGTRRSSERAQIFYQLGRVRRAQGRHGDAVAVLEQAAAIDLGNAPVLQDLFAAAGAAGDNQRSERAGRALLALARGGDPQRLGFSVVEVLLRLRDLAAARGDEGQASELLESAVMSAVRDAAEFRGLAARLRAENQLGALASALDKRIAAAATPADEAQAWSEVAELRETLGQSEEALEAALHALELRADDAGTDQTTRAVVTRLGLADRALAKIEATVERRRRRGDGPLVARLLLWAGELAEEQLRDAARALTYYRRAADTGEVPSAAATALARVGAACDPVERARALERLERIVRDETTPEGKAEALFRLAEAQLQDAGSRAAGLASLQAAAERSSDVERTMAMVQKAGVSDDEMVGLLPLYERTARLTGNDQQLLDALTRRAQGPGASVEAIREGYDLATALRDDARAEALLGALVTVAEQDPASGDAVWGLIELGKRFRARGDLERAHAKLAAAMEHAEAERIEPLLRALVTDARERTGQSPLAARILETLRGRTPDDAAIWNELFETYVDLGDLDGCERLARERLAQLAEPGERNEIRMRVARLRGAADPADAVALEMLRDTLLDDPANTEAAELLARHYEATGDVDALVDLRQGQLAALEEKGDRTALAPLAAALARSVVAAGGAVGVALEAYGRALRAAPADRALLDEVLGLCTPDRSEDEMRELDALLTANPAPADFGAKRAAAYREAGQWTLLVTLLREQARREKDGGKAAALLREAATVTRRELDDAEAAIDIARAAHRAAGPDRRARTQSAQLLAQLLADTQQYQPAIQMLSDALQSATPGEREQIASTLEHLRLMAAQPAPDPDMVILDDLQEITDHN
jgi:tetratricopeptide (TPR) repeat protein